MRKKMNKKMKISMAAIAALMLSILAVNFAMAATSLAAEITTNKSIANSNANVVESNEATTLAELTEDAERLKELTPNTLEEAEESIYPVRTRYILWTHDGVHVMWGVYGNGRFVGTDNLGKRCWGIYGKGIFAGFYDGEFFWGKYENGAWKAQYLFGVERSYGKFVVFPQPTITAEDVTNLP